MNTCLHKARCSFFLLAALLPFHAWAGLTDVCVPVGSASVQVQFPSVTVQRDAEVGTVLAIREISTPMECQNLFYPTGGAAQYFKSKQNPAYQPTTGYAYPTSVAGVGLYWETANYDGSVARMSGLALNNEYSPLSVPFPYLGKNTYTLRQTFKLIKTGAVVGGTFSFPSFKVMTKPNSVLGDLYNKELFTFSFASSPVVSASCYLTKSSVVVELGRVPAADFNGPGSTKGGKGFSLDLDCNAGTAINLTLSEQFANTRYPGTINLLDVAQSAKGVGIQLLDAHGEPVPLGKRRYMGMAKDGPNSIDMTARYIQTGQNVTAGKTAGVLSLTLSYQ
ncbi:TPA: fimbrial protein [Pseudomonas aeruginosa]